MRRLKLSSFQDQGVGSPLGLAAGKCCLVPCPVPAGSGCKAVLEKAVPQGWSRDCSLAVQVALRCVCSSQVCPVLQSKGTASQRDIASGGPLTTL